MSDVLKYSDVKSWDGKAIDAKVAELRKEIFKIRMQKKFSGVEKPHLLKIKKKNIARLLTAKNSNKKRGQS